ncbi:TIGR03808 family TAT-translocated repetitive protein [Starkeya sp. ORNL1]|uniref:TIGR03808 family TAT-translocated repetitive protein n=1 Tax=Starkeya sp. ORNL1 TaxID=2709380 RepID=UPI001FEFBCC0|nr:TIGR03808 family TAT-translocated repetitive protein [Starkeya sp. ORNL1]
MTPRSQTRRHFLALAGALAGVAAARPALAAPLALRLVTEFGVKPGVAADQGRALQKALDTVAISGETLYLPAGIYRTSALKAANGTRLAGAPGASRLVSTGDAVLLSGGDGLVLDGLAFEGGGLSVDRGSGVRIRDCVVTGAPGNAIALTGVAGEVSGCTIARAGKAALFAQDSRGLRIEGNNVDGAADNGILVWRSTPGPDGTLVSGNRISGIGMKSGGSGQYGNGINIFRAGNVIVANNRISGCAYSAVRGNAASNLQVLGNNCSGMGEVAIFVEFGFQGAVVASNIVEDAAVGICITNFKEGGRLAVVQGNLVRNLRTGLPPGNDPGGASGVGIVVEADSAVSGNVVEGAPSAGIRLGYGPYLRDVSITGNVVRNAGIGIGVSLVEGAGSAVIADNLISGARDGAIVGLAWEKPLTGDLLAPGARIDPRLTLNGNRSL